jgi:hypothetical protein
MEATYYPLLVFTLWRKGEVEIPPAFFPILFEDIAEFAYSGADGWST